MKVNRKAFELEAPAVGEPLAGVQASGRGGRRRKRAEAAAVVRRHRKSSDIWSDRFCMILLVLSACYILIHLIVAVQKGVF